MNPAAAKPETPTELDPARDGAPCGAAGLGEGQGEGGAVAPAIGRDVGRGVTWMFAASTFIKFAGLGAQVPLGWWLSEGDWGVFGIAIAVSSILQVFRDGGAKHLLIQRGQGDYPALSGPMFWMAGAFNGAIGLLLALAAPLVAAAYGEPRVAGVLLVLALWVPLTTPANILTARLQVALRFPVIARIDAASSVIRLVLMVLLAWLGFGPLSFVLPWLATAAFDGTCAYLATRDRPWARAPEPSRWPDALVHTRWVIFGALTTSAVLFGDRLVAGLVVDDTAVLGRYQFAYQLSIAVAVLLTANLQSVLFPALARLKDEPARHARAFLRVLRTLVLLVTPTSVGVAVIIAPVEAILWQGKWAGAVVPIQVFSLLYPLRMVFDLTQPAIMSRGGFKQVSLLMLVQGLGVMAASGLGAALLGTTAGIALAVSAYLAVSSLALSAGVLRRWGLGPGELAGAVFPSWAIALAAAAAALAAGAAAAAPISSLSAPLIARLPEAAGAMVPHALTALLTGGLFTLLFGAGVRLLLPGQLRDAMSAAPAGLARRAERLLLLKPSPQDGAGGA